MYAQSIRAYDSIYGKLQRDTGHFEFKVDCYHYETRTTQRPVVKSKGVYTRNYTSTEKVITHTNTETLAVRHCVDESDRIAPLADDQALVVVEYEIQMEHSNPKSE